MSQIENQPLLQSYQKGALQLNNRLVMAPMTRSRSNNPETAPTELNAEYYAQRASAGLIISEGTPISPQGVGYTNIPGIYSAAQVEGWKKVTNAVHEKGGKIYAQLWHVGRMSHPDFHNGALPVAPSAINPNDQAFTAEGFKPTVTPRALEIEEIKGIVEDFKKAAANAVEAGFDGVEIHSSNGYLFHQFFSRCSNQRTDEYGGTIENRARFFFEVLDAVKEIIDLSRVGVRLNPSMHEQFGITVDEQTAPTFEYIVQRLNNYNLAYLHLTEASPKVAELPYAIKEIAKHFRPLYHGTLIINGGFTQETGNKVLEDGLADLVAYGRPFIANPDLVERFAENAELNAPDYNTFYSNTGEVGYTDYPTLAEVSAA
ncbi:alkene reductase [Rufibacter tibetensis]|uniref:NADH:flavin oxidoreductase n=1 Tax=Rufibacter tibetensis TaxID=512763 RepID=A0A0N7HWB9_9BACT|nr:alkene reductase [Rufibacter tibetensis]ALI98816.1 NADH:flavin oxidoreductase [Rufibacter tibetensis]